MRLTDSLIVSERYRGEPSTDESGRTTWPTCVVWDDEVQGLGVRILPPVRGKPSRKDFIVTWKVGLKSRTMAIGTYGIDCTLRQARRIARQAIDLARRGRDPIQERQHALGIGTTEDLASRFLFEHNAAKKKPAPLVAPEPESSEQPAGEAAPIEPSMPPEDVVAAPDAQPQFDPVPSEAPQPASVAPPTQQAPAGASTEVPAEPRAEATTAPDQVAANAPLPAPAEAEAAPTVASPPSQLAPTASDEQVDRLDAAAPPPLAPASAPAVSDPPPAGGPNALATPAPAAPAGAAPPQLAADAVRRAHDAQAAASRSPARMRMVALPAALHREIEQRARALGLTMTAYLQALVDLERAAAEKSNGGGATTPMTRAEEIFSKVQARQGSDAPAVLPDRPAGE